MGGQWEAGGAFKRGFFQFFLNISKTMQIRKKKSCSFKIWGNCKRGCPEQYTKSPRRQKVGRGAGKTFEGGFFQFFLNILKTMQIRRKNPNTVLNCVKFPVKILLTFFLYTIIQKIRTGENYLRIMCHNHFLKVLKI